MEHFRTQDDYGKWWQWCDTDLCMIIDRVTGDCQRFGEHRNSIGTFAEAKEYIQEFTDHTGRDVIVQLKCIAPYKVGDL